MTESWLDWAPKPPPLAPGKAWHVFISYRSVNRPWVLALYDGMALATRHSSTSTSSPPQLLSRSLSARRWKPARVRF